MGWRQKWAEEPGAARLQYFAEPVDLEIVGLAQLFLSLLDLVFHQGPGEFVPGDIADGQVNAFFNDEPVAADVYHVDPFCFFEGAGALVFALDRVEEDGIGLICKGEEAELGIVKESIDEMELDQYFLAQQLGPVEKYLMVLKVIDVLYLEGGHTDLPDHFSRGGAKLYFVRCYDGIGQVGSLNLLGQQLMGEVEIVLIDKAAVKAFFLLLESAIPIIWEDLVLEILSHSIMCDIRFLRLRGGIWLRM
jgi:hypothetical protein